MSRYFTQRILLTIPTLAVLTILIFGLMRFVPGDPAGAALGDEAAISSHRELREKMGLEEPLYKQYFIWISHVGRGDFGDSYLSHQPVLKEVVRRFPVTLELTFMGLLAGLIVSIPLGVLSAIRQNTWVDYLGRVLAVSGTGIPIFWTGVMVLLLGSLYFNWVPPTIYSSPGADLLANLELMAVASLILGYRLAGSNARMMRSATLEALRQDYVRTAWSKGLMERVIVIRHVLKNAMIPVLTLVGGEIAFLIGGTVIVETMFSIPGMGRYLVEGISNRDYPVVQGVTMMIGTGVLLVNLAVDLSYGWLDPRIRYSN